MLSNQDIQGILPHRYPFLLVDKIIEIEYGKKAVGVKNVTVNEPFFQGHFPGFPIMPGVLIVESMAQVGAIAILGMEEHKNKLAVFTGIDGMRFRRQVVPGDTLRMEVEMLNFKRGIGKAKAQAYVGEELAASGELMFAIVNK